MRRANLLVFDDYVHPSAVVVTTSQQFNKSLASNDQMAIQAVVDNITGTPAVGFAVKIYHSTDGRNWMARGSLGGSDINLSATTLTAGSYFGYSLGATPMLAYAQLQITMPAGMGAHVRIHVTKRDWGH